MQATQSNNASNFFESDFFRSDSTGPRDIDSAHDQPMNGHSLTDYSTTGCSIDGGIGDLPSTFTAPIAAARKYLEHQRGGAFQPDGVADKPQEPMTREQITREQDRRLERSLYEGHSIEAGLSFEEAQGFVGNERAYLADSDGSEPLFPYAAPGSGLSRASRRLPDHDQATVRGAISRLAHESRHASGQIQKSSKAAQAPGQMGGSAEVQTTLPSAFADVALRVWAKTRNKNEAQESSVPARLSVRALPMQPSQLAGMTAEEKHARLPSATPFAAEPQPLPSLAEAVVAQVAEFQRGSAFGDAALAHDARNLLSALGLYSDLLNTPGVLAEQYRHYAEELKLIAGRSQVLIDRMLTRSGTRSAVAHPQDATSSRFGLPIDPGAADAEMAKAATLSKISSRHQTGIHATPTTAGALTAMAGKASATSLPATSLVDLLMRWGSLLSTLAHGTLDVCFGPQAATPVPMEAESLERILVNLVRNARAATIAGGAIRIGVGLNEDGRSSATCEATGSGQAIVLTVDDSGCGMTEAHIERILGLAPCKSVEPPLESGRQGLGLQVVRELASASGGRLAILSSPGRGTRVEIRWPISAASAGTEWPVPVTRLDAAAMAMPETAARPSLFEAQTLPQALPVSVGPDGFSEAELRAMMLRLHRHGSIKERPQREEAVDRRRPLPEGTYRPGLAASLSGEASPLARFEAARFQASRFEENQSDVGQPERNNFSAVKGAIAC